MLLKTSKKNILDDLNNALYIKRYPNGWSFLEKYLTAEEFMVCFSLSLRADYTDNNLKPFTDKTTGEKLSQALGVSRINLIGMLHKLFELGVCRKFEEINTNKPYTKYWIFNPYLSFVGEVIDSSIVQLFSDTHIHKAFHNPNYELTPQEIIDLKIRPSTAKRRKAK